MTEVVIARADRHDMPLLDVALRALSAELGDRHSATLDALRAAFAIDQPAFHALLARKGEDAVGALVWTPVFSTTMGGGGVFVSDLWVASSVRGRGIGNRLLARAVTDAEHSTGACFLKLAVHRTNPSAFAYYRHVGFTEQNDMSSMILQGDALQNFIRT